MSEGRSGLEEVRFIMKVFVEVFGRDNKDLS